MKETRALFESRGPEAQRLARLCDHLYAINGFPFNVEVAYDTGWTCNGGAKLEHKSKGLKCLPGADAS
jgi:hypothetical protein